ncbi:MAG: glycoside hydrolase family 3 N-terminal domain-containing protein [Bdellovibrionota bacterium]
MNLGPALNIEGGKTDQSAVERLKAYGQELGKSLFELGINCNFAPVLDILTEPTNIAIGDRCFGKEPSSVVIRGGAVLMGMNASGILTCIKHFPGQGNAKIDTHESAATIDISLTLLHQRELFPFVSLHKYAPMLMVSHCKYPSLDTKPASLSKAIMTDLIRTDLKYTGVVVTDDMTMGAMPSDIKAWKESILASIAAGADLVLVCNSLEKWQMALDAIRAESSRSHAFAKRLAEAAARVTQMRQKFFR